MTITRTQLTIRLGCAVLAVWAYSAAPLDVRAQASAPRYEVDPTWPKPLPEKWMFGPVGAVCVDAQDHVLVLNRQGAAPINLDAAQKAPAVIEFDEAGNVVNTWKDGVFPPPLVNSFHSCHFDADNNVWILSTQSGIAQKFSHDGRTLLLQLGKSGVVDSSDGTAKGKPLNSDTVQFFAPADVSVDRHNGDIYVDDGDGTGNRRIAVMDRAGKFLRQWQPQDMKTIHCMALANDGLVYLCNRPDNRVQVYDTMGNFKRNIDIPWTPLTPLDPNDTARKRSGAGGSAVSVTLSRDAAQRWLYVNNQNNSQIDVVDRQAGTVVSSFGRAGHYAGQFDLPLNIAVDSKGTVYVTENTGQRIQRFKMVGQSASAATSAGLPADVGPQSRNRLPLPVGQKSLLPARAQQASTPKDINPVSGHRLPFPTRDDLDEDGKKVFDELTRHRDSDLPAKTRDEPSVRLYSPNLAKPMADVHRYLKYDTALGNRLTEIAVLVTSRELDGQYEWTQWEEHGRDPEDPRHIEAAIIDTIKYCKPLVGLGEKESAVIALGREMLGRKKVSSETFATVLRLFGRRGTVDLVELMGLYGATIAEQVAFDVQLRNEQPLLPARAVTPACQHR